MPKGPKEPNLIIVTGYDFYVGRFVCRRLGTDIEEIKPFSSIGFMYRKKLIAGIVFNNFQRTYRGKPAKAIEISMAADSAHWFKPFILQFVFNYVFNQLDCLRTTCLIDAQNQPLQAFLKRIGFTPEGTMEKAGGDIDLLIMGMTKDKCRWIKKGSKHHGEKINNPSRPGENGSSAI